MIYQKFKKVQVKISNFTEDILKIDQTLKLKLSEKIHNFEQTEKQTS